MYALFPCFYDLGFFFYVVRREPCSGYAYFFLCDAYFFLCDAYFFYVIFFMWCEENHAQVMLRTYGSFYDGMEGNQLPKATHSIFMIVCMCVCMCVYVYHRFAVQSNEGLKIIIHLFVVYTYIHTYIHTYICVCIFTYIYILSFCNAAYQSLAHHCS
jgi:hypothetical protein